MSDNIKNKINSIINTYKDQLTGKNLKSSDFPVNISNKNGHISIFIEIDPSQKEEFNKLSEIIKKDLNKIESILSVNIVLTSEKSVNHNQKEFRFKINSNKILAIASGKGGVGKSTFAVNYAVALKKIGYNVGILDADIYGPSVPRMMGIADKPKINQNKKLIPLENYGVKCMSIGFMIDVDTPAIWRGPMVMKALEQMFNGVDWGSLDYLIIDLPPGTGDAQLSLAQNLKIDGAIIISTPQDIALIDARKGINMFKKVNIPVIGIIENMSYFICNNCNERHEIFSNGGAKKEAVKFDIAFLGDLPIDISLRIKSDEGEPICISSPQSNIAKSYLSIAQNVSKKIN
tara:strand:- start:1625 stop:2662 length:1038 start_codon:yes stop_codon:yes gene_type:complete